MICSNVVSLNMAVHKATVAICDMFSDLRTTRARLLEMFTDITCNPEIMKNATDAYFSLLQGLFTSISLKLYLIIFF